MDTDSTDYEKQKEHRDSVSNDCHLPKSIRICRTICAGNELYRRLLDYNVCLLCVGSIIFLGFFLFT